MQEIKGGRDQRYSLTRTYAKGHCCRDHHEIRSTGTAAQQMIPIKERNLCCVRPNGLCGNKTPVWFHAFSSDVHAQRVCRYFAKKENVKFHLSKIGLTLEGICSFYLFLFNQNWVTENNNLRGPGLRNLSKNDHQRLLSEVYGTCGKSARSDS